MVVVVIGRPHHQTGERRSRANIELPGDQQALLEALAKTGKPIVGVVITDGPIAFEKPAKLLNSVLIAWQGGTMAGTAVAEALFGLHGVDPAGRLPMAWPRISGQDPIGYDTERGGRPWLPQAGNHEKQWVERYQDVEATPLWPFGHGGSYTHFSYDEVRVSRRRMPVDGEIVVRVKVRNDGDRPGDTVPQLYVSQVVASRTRPKERLIVNPPVTAEPGAKGVTPFPEDPRVTLEPGETRWVDFRVRASDLAVMTEKGPVVEPGKFNFWVGPSSAVGLPGSFRISEEDGRRR